MDAIKYEKIESIQIELQEIADNLLIINNLTRLIKLNERLKEHLSNTYLILEDDYYDDEENASELELLVEFMPGTTEKLRHFCSHIENACVCIDNVSKVFLNDKTISESELYEAINSVSEAVDILRPRHEAIFISKEEIKEQAKKESLNLN